MLKCGILFYFELPHCRKKKNYLWELEPACKKQGILRTWMSSLLMNFPSLRVVVIYSSWLLTYYSIRLGSLILVMIFCIPTPPSLTNKQFLNEEFRRCIYKLCSLNITGIVRARCLKLKDKVTQTLHFVSVIHQANIHSAIVHAWLCSWDAQLSIPL